MYQTGQDYHEYRMHVTEPEYGLAKVKQLVTGLQDRRQQITEKDWTKLSAAEKFTYCAIHPEQYFQACFMLGIESDADKKIYARQASPFIENHWSVRQSEFFTKERKTVIKLLTQTVRGNVRMGANLKLIAVETKANEMIPTLIDKFQKDKRDKDLLTVLMVLMKEGDDPRFAEWPPYQDLYGKDANYGSSIPASDASEKTILKLAAQFHRGLKTK